MAAQITDVWRRPLGVSDRPDSDCLARRSNNGPIVDPPAVIGRPDQQPTLRGPLAGLLFDMGDVLYDATCWRRWLLQVLSHLGVYTNYRSFFRVWDRDYLAEAHRGHRSFCEAFVAFLRSVGLSPAQIDEVRAACQRRRDELEADVRPLPGVRSTLIRLHQQGIVLAVLSDSEHPHEELEARLDRLGLSRLFTAVISSFDLVHTKPEPHGYQAALRAMGQPPEQVAFVGHDADELAGAKAVRMRTIAFNFDPDARADVYLTRFDQLFELVQQASRLAAAG